MTTEIEPLRPDQTDVNVGGPDGGYCTVGTVLVPSDGSESRQWLWDALDEVRKRYLAHWHAIDTEEISE